MKSTYSIYRLARGKAVAVPGKPSKKKTSPIRRGGGAVCRSRHEISTLTARFHTVTGLLEGKSSRTGATNNGGIYHKINQKASQGKVTRRNHKKMKNNRKFTPRLGV